MSIIDGYEADELYAIKRAVVEWRDAREAFWSLQPGRSAGTTIEERFPAEVWTRLGHAEHALMELARGVKS